MHDERAIPVPPPLRPWVSGISVGSTGSTRTVLEPPDHATALVLRSVPGRRGELAVTGPRTGALYSTGVPGPTCLALRIRPGLARRLVDGPAARLVDRSVPLQELGGPLADGLAGVTTWSLLVVRLAAVLAVLEPVGDPVGEAAVLLTAGAGPSGVRAAARGSHISERHLRTLFAAGVGISPKRFATIDRVRAVLAHAADRPWRRLATDLGYHDQSHMAGEFRRLMGITLTDYARDRLPARPRCADPTRVVRESSRQDVNFRARPGAGQVRAP